MSKEIADSKGIALLSQSAVFSPCRTWRYSLTRDIAPLTGKGVCTFIGLNPSTADEVENDPTIRRCIDFARRWGFARYAMLNLFAYRSTDPMNLHNAVEEGIDIVGPDNDEVMRAVMAASDMVVAAWGAFPWDKRVATLLSWPDRPDLFCLGLTKNKSPRHPLYVRGDTIPTIYKASPVIYTNAKGETSLL